MANITAQDVAKLREMTNSGMMDCKRALVEAEGDFDKAVKILREKGLAKAAKKAGRIAAEGLINVKVEGNVGVIVEINSETDFCAKSDKFIEFVNIITDTILEKRPATIEELLTVTVKGSDVVVNDLLTEKIATIGENIKLRRFEILEGNLVSYIHDGGRLGTLVKFDSDKADSAAILEAVKNTALQITALNAQYIDRDCVPADVVENEKDVQLKLVIKENEAKPKPDAVVQKIVEGRLRKFFEEITLLDQTYFKDDSVTVGKYLENTAKAEGATLAISKFVRFEKGEGIEKKVDNFADEVANMTK